MENTAPSTTPTEEMVLVALTHFERQDGNPQPSGRIASWLNTRDQSTITWTSQKVGSTLRGLRMKGLVIAIDAATNEPTGPKGVAPGVRALWKLVEDVAQVRPFRTVNVYLTAKQCLYLADADFVEDTVITEVDDVGGIFVETAENLGAEGSGVWVDARGKEHVGPGLDFEQLNETSKAIIEMAQADANGEEL